MNKIREHYPVTLAILLILAVSLARMACAPAIEAGQTPPEIPDAYRR
jgi:hypothetical protein